MHSTITRLFFVGLLAIATLIAPGAAHAEGQGYLSGHLTNPTGAGVAAFVDAYDGAGARVASTFTGPTGQWMMPVAAGQVKVRFSVGLGTLTQWAYGKASADLADPITVAPGAFVTVNDVFAASPPTFSGRVTDDAGKALGGIAVSVVDPSATQPGFLGYATTSLDGTYLIRPWSALPPRVTLEFADQNTPKVYAAEYAGDTTSLTSARTYPTAGTGNTTVDATLSVGGVITGRVITERKPTPVSGFCPSAYEGAAGGYLRNVGVTCSDSNGIYRLTALPATTATVLLSAPWQSGMADVWYAGAVSQATATRIPVSLGSTTTLRPTKVSPGATLTGVVRDSSGAPVAGAAVVLSGDYPGRAGGAEGIAASTDANGRYSMAAPAGTYTPMAYTINADLAPAWSGGATSKAAATPLTLREFKSTTVNFVLPAGAHVTGQTVGVTGQPTAVEGMIYTPTGEYIGDFSSWPDGSSFTSTPLPAGTFVLKAEDWRHWTPQGPPTTWYDGATSLDTATRITLTTGGSATITFRVPW